MKNTVAKNIFIIFTSLLIINSAVSSQPVYPKPNFNKESIQRHLNFLGSDLFEGRGTGTTGGNLAAKYLALEFDQIKLKPIGNNNTYYQYVPIHGSKPLASSKLEIETISKNVTLNLNDDYILLQAGEQTFLPIPFPIVFVGYGIISPEYDYNDYHDVDVENKVVMFLDGEPDSDDRDYFNAGNPTIYSTYEAKQRIALSRGARGSILIPTPDSSDNNYWSRLINSYSFEYLSLAYSASSNFGVIIKPEIIEHLLNSSGYSFSDLLAMKRKNVLKSFPLNSKISFKGIFKERDFLAPNVIGLLEGKDPKLKDTYIIVTAHYDHLGIGPVVNNDSIYNGVYDNAAGAAVLIELAKEFSKSPSPPKRSIVFLLLTGEESGLLGSKYYTDNPIVPLYKTIANINIDGVASFDNFKSIVGIGREYSTLEEFLNRTAKKFDLNVIPIPENFVQIESFTRSDQYAFADAGVPAILIADGPDYINLTYQEGMEKLIYYAENIYHTPFDDLYLPINFDAVNQHAEILYDFIFNLADSDNQPEWVKGSPYINARLRSIAEKK